MVFASLLVVLIVEQIQVVLARLDGHPSKWHTFLANNVTAILNTLPDVTSNYHVSTADNPANCAFRGMSTDFSLWWDGPIWLAGEFPQIPHIVILLEDIYFM